MFSRIIALLVLILISPVMAIISVIIIFDNGFPIIYIQKNYGKNHNFFYLYKFRTMQRNAPEIPTEKLYQPQRYLLRSGKFLRKYSLDELPQLINIIEGKMRFIGPRPCMVNNEEIVKELREKYGVDKLTPGITGWAQVNGRDLNSFRKKVELDHYYMLNESFLLNIKILIKTILVVLSPRDVKH